LNSASGKQPIDRRVGGASRQAVKARQRWDSDHFGMNAVNIQGFCTEVQ
jgi:hypothetical protein